MILPTDKLKQNVGNPPQNIFLTLFSPFNEKFDSFIWILLKLLSCITLNVDTQKFLSLI